MVAVGYNIPMLVSMAWFVFTMLFYKGTSPEHKASIEEFAKNLRTPVTHTAETLRRTELMQFKILGRLCLAFGGIITLGILIPNPASGRLAFLFCGGFSVVIGSILYGVYLRKRRSGGGDPQL